MERTDEKKEAETKVAVSRVVRGAIFEAIGTESVAYSKRSRACS